MADRNYYELEFKAIHDRLTAAYRGDADFFKLHTACWLLLERVLINKGFVPDFVADEESGTTRLQEITNITPRTVRADWTKKGCKDPAEIVAQ
jgi:hypothetical protein